MKNPFEKKDHTGFIILGIGAAIAAAGVAYLYLTDSGEDARRSLKHVLKDHAKDYASGVISKKTGIAKKTVKKVADHISK